MTNEIIVNNLLRQNIQNHEPYDISNLDRLSNTCHLTAKFTEQDITNTGKYYKNNTPGHSLINK